MLGREGTRDRTQELKIHTAQPLSWMEARDVTARVIEDCGMEDFDKKQIQHLRKALGCHDKTQDLLAMEDACFLQALGLVREVEGRLLPVFAGLLLVGKEAVIQEKLPTVGYALLVKHNGDLKFSRRYSGGLLEAVESMEQDLLLYNPAERITNADGTIGLDCRKYAPPAVHEGIWNAVGHRSYARRGEVLVLVDEEGLTISSPGGFMEPGDMDKPKDAALGIRNPLLHEVLREIGKTDRSLRGMERIVQETLRMGMACPDDSDSDDYYVRLYFPDMPRDVPFVLTMHSMQEQMGEPLTAPMWRIASIVWSDGSALDKKLSQTLQMTIRQVREMAVWMEEYGWIHIVRTSTEGWMIALAHPSAGG